MSDVRRLREAMADQALCGSGALPQASHHTHIADVSIETLNVFAMN